MNTSCPARAVAAYNECTNAPPTGEKTMKRYFALLLASLLLASCAVYTPAGSVVVDPNGPGPRHDGGGFCPPGQAKKGNC